MAPAAPLAPSTPSSAIPPTWPARRGSAAAEVEDVGQCAGPHRGVQHGYWDEVIHLITQMLHGAGIFTYKTGQFLG